MKKYNRPAGLHLWKVRATGGDCSLWITTNRHTLRVASAKAERFLKSAQDTVFGHVPIIQISYEGTIDC